MLRDVAVTRIQDGLGFAARQADKIVLRLQEAQRDMEKGKTLPRFLLQENQTFTLALGASTANLPTGFLRMDDDNPPHFTATGEDVPTFISIKRSFKDVLEAISSSTPAAPKVGYIRNSVIDFIVVADKAYTFTWNYYKAGVVLTTNVENVWLANAPEWLIGEAGWRMAMDDRDKDGITIFDTMRKTARATWLAEAAVWEEQSGPLLMGANL